MSILTDILAEELDRCRRIKKVYLRNLGESDIPLNRREQLLTSLRRNNEDIFRIKRALAPIPPELPEEE